ncbi:MAG: cren protein [Desulfurococcales archaeon]|nr:cren protein [Desulfurococcales archaeon]
MDPDKGEVRKASVIRVSSLGDIARLASTLASRMLIMPVYRFKYNGKVYYTLQTIYKDYYRFYGIPIVYYYVDEEGSTDGKDVKYILARADETGERVEVSDKTRTGWVVIPIINLAEKPDFIPDNI